MEKLAISATIPEFKLLDQDGKEVSIKEAVGISNLVIYFYPKDETPGCIKEACYFRDQFEVFRDAGARVIGISPQSVESHKSFADHYKLSFTLLSDPGNKVARLFRVASGEAEALPARVTFVVDKTGTIVYVFDSQKDALRHVDEALRVIKDLK